MTYTKEELEKMVDKYGDLNLSYKKNLTSLPENMPAIGGSLYLSGCTGLTSLPDNLTVGGSLDLRGCTGLTSLPDNLTVGSWLDLSGCTGLTSLPDSLTVGGSLYLRVCTGLTEKERNKKCKKLEVGYNAKKGYIYCDGILTHVNRSRKFGQYTYYYGKIKGKNVIYDGTNYAHCKSFREGVSDLQFKKMKDRGQEQYSDLTPESILPAEDMIAAYRIITGSCKAGTEQFLSTLPKIKKEYSVKEAIELTKGQYNATVFEDFFRNKD